MMILVYHINMNVIVEIFLIISFWLERTMVS